MGPRRVRISGPGYAPETRDIVVRQGGQVDLGIIDLVPQREVTAVSRYAERIDDAPSSVTVIDGREIAAFGYPTIAESLRGVRGLALSNDRVYASVSVRGIGQPNDYGSRVLVMSDGQALNDNLLNSSYIGSDGRGDLGDVERIEVVRGPGSLLYGAGAFAGVVNLVTRGRDAPNSVHVGIGSYDNAVLRGRGGFQWKFGQDKGVWASGWGAQSDGFDVEVPLTGDPLPTRVRNVERFQSGGTAGRLYLGPATMQWFVHHRTQSSPVGAYATEVSNTRNSFADTRMMVEARFEPKISNSVQLLLRAHANRYVYDGTYAFAGGLDNVEQLSGSWLGAEARVVFAPGPRFRLTVGGEGQWHPEATLSGTERSPGQPDSRYMNERRPYQFAAGYALAEGNVLSWLRLSGGVRVDVYSTFGAVVVPRGAAIIKPSKSGTLKIMGGRAFRAPSIYEQLYNDNGQSHEKALTLDAEKIVSGEIEYTHRFLEDWVALGAIHGSVADDIIETEPVPGKTTVRYANQDKRILVLGADAELRREWRKGWMLAATYGYQRARYLETPAGDVQVPNVPEHLGSLKFVVPILPTIALAGMRATVEAPRLLSNGDSTPTGVVADLTMSGEMKSFGLRYVVGLYNLTDRRYAVPVTGTFPSRTMPQNGRTFLVDLTGTFP
ncbi:MAG: TonB-dependent receptor plug domain-containing protein [Polyangiaceae bacterium]|nr:TonB-dependent receptor plug domain-containing protein [Polyangiaceae bacterium]